MSALFDAPPAMAGMAVLIVQHLDPKGVSHLSELLGRHTALTVQQAEDGVEIEPGNIYVCVPSRDLIVRDGQIHLAEPEVERRDRRPIDRLFESLATEYGDRAIAVILSGTATDGSRGIVAIKSAGGMVIVQDPEEAEFDGMPRSAVETGVVDVILKIKEIPECIARVAAAAPSTPAAHGADDARSAVESGRETEVDGDGEGTHVDLPEVALATLQEILDVLNERFDYDFNDYKRPTLLRRTQRRMSLRNMDDFGEYATLVRDDANESASLFRDLMINVSSFFRDREAWEQLESLVIDPLIESRASGEEIRVWSVGCATGEEAYTIGMLLTERIEAAGKRLRPQIFATDVSDSLRVARAGVYPSAIAEQLSSDRLSRFFVERGDGHEARKALRDMIVFARHNVITDPPFSRMDLICCRNMLIYIEPATQRKILSMFNFALRDGGTLFLGSAETIGLEVDLFEPICAPWRIFRSHRVAPARGVEFPRFSIGRGRRVPLSPVSHHRAERDEAVKLAERTLLSRFAPPAVLIDSSLQVRVYCGDTSPFLTQPGGEPTRDLLAMVSGGLRPLLRHAITAASAETRPTIETTGFIKSDGGRRAVAIGVGAIAAPPDSEPLFLVTFREIEERSAPTKPEDVVEDRTGQNIDQLDEELQSTRQELRDVSDQYDRLVEEYSTSNEEMLSVNEELQSANEELETSKEELQSLNEELNTLNNELRSKVEVVEQTNNDLNNLLASTEIATLFLDPQCRIRWFTPAIRGILNLIASDVGRPIRDIASSVTGSHLESEAASVLKSLIPVEGEVDDEHGHCYIRRILPYRTSDNRIDGVVATFVDITEHKRAQRMRERLMHELSHRIKNTLATVQAIVHGLGARSASLPEFLAAFEPRLAALARAHALLTIPGDERIELHYLIEREVVPYVGEDSPRVSFDGGEIAMEREQAIALALVFHELVTNASKYGALSTPTGSIAVRWAETKNADGARVRIEWIESGGPPITSNGPRGFGSMLIESSVTHDLAGTVNMNFARSGLHCTIELPLEGRGEHERTHNTIGDHDANGDPSANRERIGNTSDIPR